MRIVFMGTSDFSVPVLAAILSAGHEVAAVYSQPPRRGGRGMAETTAPVHAFAEQHGIPVFTPKNFKDPADRKTFAAHKADAAVVVAYGLLLPEEVLNAPRRGCFNVHASRLPRWRGAAPIQRAIMAGDASTAVMVMRMEKGLDTGPICLSREVAIGPATTAAALHDQLSKSGAELMVEALEKLVAGTLESTPQATEGVTYAAKIDKAETQIDFNQPAEVVAARIRGLSPFPGAWIALRSGGGEERLKVLNAHAVAGSGAPGEVLGEVKGDGLIVACASGAVSLDEVQRAGKRSVSAAEFLRGYKVSPGDRLG